MARRYLWTELPESGEHELPRAVATHAGTVLRARSGDTLTLFDGRGREASAEVIGTASRRIRVRILGVRHSQREAAVQLELGISLPKGARADWLFEHGTEIGIAVFQPLVTERGQQASDRRERWQRIVESAAGQCDRARVPIIQPPQSLSDWLASDLPKRRVLAAFDAPPVEACPSDRAALLVGPEGGLSPVEIDAARNASFAPHSLSPLTLRAETAALCAATLMLGAR